MEVVHERCCGLDIHKRTVVACLLRPGQGGQPEREVRSFSTMTRGLLELADWLQTAGCTHVAMASTGSFWKPLYNLLEGSFELLLVNAQHLKAVPGRKTDVKDAAWIADLLRHGLLRASFVPGRPERELRELVRYRTSLIRERAAEVNRIQKVLEGANIKLAAVATNVVGVSGRAMLEALVAGNEDPEALADLARGRLREKRAALEEALAGRLGAHQRFLLRVQLRHLDDLDTTIATVGEEIEVRLRPFAEAAERLLTIPGVGPRTAQTFLTEVGPDMRRFPTSGHLASWAAVCPGNRESAGKRQSGRTRKGSPWLRSALVEAAQAASRTQTYLGAQYRRLAARRGGRRATMAVAHSILLIAYHLLRDGGTYEDLGANYFDQRDRQAVQRRLIHRLEALGYNVHLEPAA
ncbi:MAG TPA: IS110 family transposase [Dehalococcoidia bacterium]|nr:IS110 family transposase [Dehalococcoidia bacterium]